MDLRNRIVGLCETIKYIQNAVDGIENITITSAPCYVSNLTLQTDLKTPCVKQVAVERFSVFHGRKILHPNPLIQYLSDPHLPDNPIRHLRRQWPRDLLTI